MVDEKKFLDQAGVQYLWSQLSLEDYPNNETLIAVLNAIDTTKADKNEIPTLTSELTNDSNFIDSTTLNDYYNKTEVDAFHETLEDYVDNQVAALVNAAPETLDTLGELATAFQENKEVVDALDDAIATKYSSSNPPPYPVTSVNGKTGAVSLSIPTVPTKVSAFTNDAGYITQDDVPVRGIDYWTEADKEEIVQQVLTVMGMHIVGVVGANNDIVFTGKLPEGTYQLKYEDAEGNVQQIGTIEVGAEELVNWLPISVGADGSIYNADDTPGYKANTRYSASSDAEINYRSCYVTGYIAVKKDQTLRVANIIMDKNERDGNLCSCYMFDTAKANAKRIHVADGTFDGLGAVWNDNGYLTQLTIPEDGFIRLQASYIGSDSVVTLE